MTVDWGDLAARARGFAARHLLGRRMAAVRGATDVAAVARGIAEAGYATAEPATAHRVEEAVARLAAEGWRILGRWAGPRRRAVLAVLFEEETVRTLLGWVRGLAEGLPVEEGFRGRRGIRAGSLAELAEELSFEPKSPGAAYAAPLRAQAAAVQPDLWSLELDLQRIFFRRAAAGARSGDRPLDELVSRRIDHRNLWTALIAGPEKGLSVDEAVELFLPGGRRLSRAGFESALRDGTGPMRRTDLAHVFGGALGRALRQDVEISALPATAEADLLRQQRRWFRTRPLSSAGVTVPCLALAAEQRTIRRIAWSLELDLPARYEEAAA